MPWFLFNLAQWCIGLVLLWDAGALRGPLERGLLLAACFVAIDVLRVRAADRQDARYDMIVLSAVHVVGLVGLLMHPPLGALVFLVAAIVEPVVRYRLWQGYSPSHIRRSDALGRLAKALPLGLVSCLATIWWTSQSHQPIAKWLWGVAALSGVGWSLGLSLTKTAFERLHPKIAQHASTSARAEERAYQEKVWEAQRNNRPGPHIMETPEGFLSKWLRFRLLLSLFRWTISFPLGLPLIPVYMYVVLLKNEPESR